MMLLQPRWIVRHVLLVGALVTCFIAGRWQFRRAIERDSLLNWSYTIEWVLFGAFAVLCWGWFLRDELRGEPEPEITALRIEQPVAQPVSDEEDPELAAYNRMLARLHEKERR